MTTTNLGKCAKRIIYVQGKEHTFSDHTWFDSVNDAGWVLIAEVGSENLHFFFKTDSGEILPGYCKCL
jgi:hypothetical protein